jgi:hypothetical protein
MVGAFDDLVKRLEEPGPLADGQRPVAATREAQPGRAQGAAVSPHQPVQGRDRISQPYGLAPADGEQPPVLAERHAANGGIAVEGAQAVADGQLPMPGNGGGAARRPGWRRR